MLSVAIMVSAMTRPAPTPTPTPEPVPVVQTVSDAEIQKRVDAVVTQAVARIEKQNEAENQQLKQELEDSRRRLLWAALEFDLAQKRSQVTKKAAYDPPAELK